MIVYGKIEHFTHVSNCSQIQFLTYNNHLCIKRKLQQYPFRENLLCVFISRSFYFIKKKIHNKKTNVKAREVLRKKIREVPENQWRHTKKMTTVTSSKNQNGRPLGISGHSFHGCP